MCGFFDLRSIFEVITFQTNLGTFFLIEKYFFDEKPPYKAKEKKYQKSQTRYFSNYSYLFSDITSKTNGKKTTLVGAQNSNFMLTRFLR